MKKLLGLIALTPMALTACGDIDITNSSTHYYLGHGHKGQSIDSKDEEGDWNIIRAHAEVAGDKVVTAEVLESVGYFKSKLPESAVASGDQSTRYTYELVGVEGGADWWQKNAYEPDIENNKINAEWNAAYMEASSFVEPIHKMWVDEDCAPAWTPKGDATNKAEFDAAPIQLDGKYCVVSEADIEDENKLVEITEDLTLTFVAANVDGLDQDMSLPYDNQNLSLMWVTHVGYKMEKLEEKPEYDKGIKYNWSYASGKFDISKVYSTTSALFVGKTKDEVEKMTFDVSVKSAADANIAGATATEATLYAAALQEAVLAAFG